MWSIRLADLGAELGLRKLDKPVHLVSPAVMTIVQQRVRESGREGHGPVGEAVGRILDEMDKAKNQALRDAASAFGCRRSGFSGVAREQHAAILAAVLRAGRDLLEIGGRVASNPRGAPAAPLGGRRKHRQEIMRGSMHHLDLTVKDMAVSAPFYELVLGFLGYRRVRQEPDGIDWDLQTPQGTCSIGIKPARSTRAHDRYASGLHHFAWYAGSRDDVDDLHRLLLESGARILDAPAEYPRYGDGYYAVFFADPDGMKFELVNFPPP